MSRYPVLYHSKSKGVDLAIEDMPTPHLLNAWRKLEKAREDGETQAGTMLRVSMVHELEARGCTLDPETGRWTIPAPEGQATP